MRTGTLAKRSPGSGIRSWALELDAELLPAAPAVTAEGAQALAGLLARIPGVEVVAVRPHCGGRFVLAILAVDAPDLSDALERAVVFLRSSAAAAGIGQLILVAERHAVPSLSRQAGSATGYL